jgi:hypothetical protein
MSDEECTSMERSGLRAQVGAVERAVAVRRVSGCRIRRLVEEVIVIFDDGGGVFVRERGWEGAGRGVKGPMMLIVSPVRMSV